MSDQRAPTAAQKRRGDILVKTVLATYLVTAYFAASNLGWYVALVVLGIAVFVAGFTDCVNTRKAPAGIRDGMNVCACGSSSSAPWGDHVSYAIRQAQIRQTAVDTCAHCGDLVISSDGEIWAHYRGPGSTLNRCQHTVPYGLDAEAAHGGRYVADRAEGDGSAEE